MARKRKREQISVTKWSSESLLSQIQNILLFGSSFGDDTDINNLLSILLDRFDTFFDSVNINNESDRRYLLLQTARRYAGGLAVSELTSLLDRVLPPEVREKIRREDYISSDAYAGTGFRTFERTLTSNPERIVMDTLAPHGALSPEEIVARKQARRESKQAAADPAEQQEN